MNNVNKTNFQIEELTPRQTEVLYLIVSGCSDKDIAQQLIISDKTAQNHVHHILRKLGVTNRTEAAVLGLRLGLITEEKLDELTHDKTEDLT